MKKNDLLKPNENIIRVLEIQQDKVLIIDCIKRSMPTWIEVIDLKEYSDCSEKELRKATGINDSDGEILIYYDSCYPAFYC